MIPLSERPKTTKDWSRAAELVVLVTARAFDVPAAKLVHRNRCKRRVAYGRQVAMYLLHVVFGGTYQEVGAPFGRERTTVAYACSLVEDDRDEEAFDRKLDNLEEMLTRLWSVDRLGHPSSPRVPLLGRAAA